MINKAITLALAAIEHARAKHNWSIENPETNDGKRLDILRDEVNEVALEVLRFIPTGSDRSNLRTELAQVAACALRWLEVEVGGVGETVDAKAWSDDVRLAAKFAKERDEARAETERLRRLLADACKRIDWMAGPNDLAARLRREGGIES